MSVEPAQTGDQVDLRKAEATRRRILDAAAQVFTIKGYVATRLTDIAEEAQMRAGSLYYHFESKEQIFDEVLEIGMALVFDAVRESVSALGDTATYRERIGALIRAYLTALHQHGDYASANFRNFGQIPEAMQRRHWPEREAFGAYLHNLLQGAQAAGELRAEADLSVVRMLLLGSVIWSVEWFDPARGPVEDVAAELERLLFDGEGTTPRQR